MTCCVFFFAQRKKKKEAHTFFSSPMIQETTAVSCVCAPYFLQNARTPQEKKVVEICRTRTQQQQYIISGTALRIYLMA